jgi:hypothetical protein
MTVRLRPQREPYFLVGPVAVVEVPGHQGRQAIHRQQCSLDLFLPCLSGLDVVMRHES